MRCTVLIVRLVVLFIPVLHPCLVVYILKSETAGQDIRTKGGDVEISIYFPFVDKLY